VAQLDTLLKALVDRNAEELILSDGKQPVFRFGEEMRTVSPKVLNRAQISLLISELAGQDQAARIVAGQPASFVYRPGNGTPFQCEVAGDNGIFCARLRPTPVETKAPDAAPIAGTVAGEAAPSAPTNEAVAPSGIAAGALEIDRYLIRLVELQGSDLHLSAGESPMIRLHGDMQRLDDAAPLTAEETRQMLEVLTPDRNRTEFDETHDTDFAYEIPNLARFRVNIFMDRKGAGAVFRTIPTTILTAEQLNLPKVALELCKLSKGLVVVTGPTGCGKSTTLAAMVDHINRTRSDHIITIEDPIEFVHQNQKCLVNQREIITHTDGFKKALRAALREDPDIVLVGEMRDLETIAIAIETAETGHLVFGTLHTTTACSTIDRIIDSFPADRQAQIRTMLSESLRGVIAQTLLKKIGGGRVAALEILMVTPAISNLIREGKTFQIPSLMQTGRKRGMVLLNDALMELIKKKVVAPQEAYNKAADKNGLAGTLRAAGIQIEAAADV